MVTSDSSATPALLSDPAPCPEALASTTPSQAFDAVIVGGGPRGVATLIRVAARLGADERQNPDHSAAPLRIAIVDALEVGPGATWMTSQPGQYLNNTTASATTIYPDESTELSGPPSPGPTLVDWMDEVARAGEHPAGEWVAAEAGDLRALDFTSRRLQGVYYRDQLDAAAAHPLIELTEFTALAVDLDRAEPGNLEPVEPANLESVEPATLESVAGGAEATSVVLADGRRLSAPTVVLAQGMVQSVPDAHVRACIDFADAHGLRYVRPGMPAERDFSGLPAGETVLVRGLGANFFDVIGGLAEEWGGRFEPVPGDPHGRLRYVPSGREPRIVAGSRRGMPYRSKPVPYSPQRDYRPRWATSEWFTELRGRRNLDFAAEVWPTIAKEIADQYLASLSEWVPEALRADLRAERGAAAGAQGPAWIPLLEVCGSGEDVDRVLAEAVVDPRWNWTIADLRRPTRGQTVSAEEWAEFVDRLITDELGSMSEAATHPRAAVNRVMSVLRNAVQDLGAIGAVAGESLVRDLHGWFDADGLFLASGPPSERVRRVLALIESGVVDLLGPETIIELDDDGSCFRAASAITGRVAQSRVLLETRMSKGKVTATDDPLLQSLLTSGRARIHAVDGVRTDYIEATGALVSEDADLGHNLVDASGRVDSSIVVLGIPASTTQPGSAIGATPHKSSPLLAGADIAAKQIARRAARARIGTAEAACAQAAALS